MSHLQNSSYHLNINTPYILPTTASTSTSSIPSAVTRFKNIIRFGNIINANFTRVCYAHANAIIKKHRYASMLLSRFFNMRLSNRSLISKPRNAFIESTCSHTHEKNVMQSITPYEPKSISPNAANTHRPTTNPHTSAYKLSPHVATMCNKIRRFGDMGEIGSRPWGQTPWTQGPPLKDALDDILPVLGKVQIGRIGIPKQVRRKISDALRARRACSRILHPGVSPPPHAQRCSRISDSGTLECYQRENAPMPIGS